MEFVRVAGNETWEVVVSIVLVVLGFEVGDATLVEVLES